MQPIGEFWRFHDDAALRRIEAAAMRLLTRSGCRIHHEGLLGQLAVAGCAVDFNALRCRFPEKLVRDAVAHLGARTGEGVETPPAWNPAARLWLSGSFPHFLDWPSGERRLATRQDIVALARMGHMLPEVGWVGRPLVCAEVPAGIEPLWTTLAIAETTTKPIVAGEVYAAGQIEPLVRMGEVLSGKPGDTSLVIPCDALIAPLILDRKQAECFLEKRRFGVANVPCIMPIAGMSAPVTIAGTVTLAVAEMLAGWVLGYVVNPAVRAGGIVSTGTLDMRTATACFGSPEALLQNLTTVQVCRRLYGISVVAATSYVDCKRPGLEAVFQKMYPLLAAPFGTGLRLPAVGLLSAGQDYSPVQHLLDAEIAQAVDRFWGGFEVNDETIALDCLEAVIQGKERGFLELEHTLTHFRAEQWFPRWFDRTCWQGEASERESEAKTLARMDAYWKDAVRRYEPPALDQAKIAELRRICAAAEKTLVK